MVDSRNPILEWISPGISTDLIDIRTTPLLFLACGSIHQNLQTFICGGVTIHVDVKTSKGRFQFRYVRFGCGNFCIMGSAYKLRNDRGCEDSNDHEDHHDFDE